MPDESVRVRSGLIRVITGPMFSGKTTELIRQLERFRFAKKTVVAFKPSIDTRYTQDAIASHSGLGLKSISIEPNDEGLRSVRNFLANNPSHAVGFDEINFLPTEFVELAEDLASSGITILATGLNLDFRGEPFVTTKELMVRADSVIMLTAICVRCGRRATRTQRILNGVPAPYDSPVLLIGGKEAYEARCRTCHEVPGAK